MSIFEPIQELAKWLLDTGFRYSVKKIGKIPLAIAQSAKSMRLVTLTGMAVISIALLLAIVHIVKVYNTIQENEALAESIELHINAKFSNAIKVAEATEWLIKSKGLVDNPENNTEVIQTLPWIKSSEISGIALISDRGYRVLYGKLDPSVSSLNWERIRWDQLRNRTATELKEAGEPVTLFLGIERLFRTKQEFNQGQQLTGSLVVSRAWKKDDNSWDGVVILLPVQSFNQLMRLGPEQYNSGNYDYLVDNDGFLLTHPSPFLIYGTDTNGRDLRGASNNNEVGKLPINTRDSDWIAGNDTINMAFGLMMSHQPTTVVYKNLQNQFRLTSFRLVEFESVKGKPFGIVVGQGLSYLDSLSIRFLLKSSTPLFSMLWIIAGVYSVLISVWLAFVSKFRSLHMDLLAWSRFMSSRTASDLGLIPISKGKLEDYNLHDIAAIVLSLGLHNLSKKERNNTLELLAKLSAKLQDDGWITHIWSFQSVVACRPLADPVGDGKLYFWTPTNVADYLRNLDEFQPFQIPAENSNVATYRVVYGIGDLHIKAGRIGTMQRATITVFGNSILDTVHSNEELNAYEPTSNGVLMYPIDEAIDAGIQIVGDRVIVNSRTYAKLKLGKMLK